MNVFKKVLSILLVALSVALLCSAQMNFDSGFPVKEMEPTRKESFLNNVSITPLSEMPEGYNISRFDVNEDGNVAMVLNNLDAIVVIDKDGNFMYGFKAKTHGSLYVEWGEECLNVIFVRGSAIVSLDEEGNILNVGEITTSDLFSFDRMKKRVVGDDTYVLSNRGIPVLGFLSFGFSKIEIHNKYSEEIVTIYDVSESTAKKTTLALIGFSAFFGVAITGSILEMRKRIRKSIKAKQGIGSNDKNNLNSRSK